MSVKHNKSNGHVGEQAMLSSEESALKGLAAVLGLPAVVEDSSAFDRRGNRSLMRESFTKVGERLVSGLDGSG
jgi:hypothetical protein